MPSSSGCLYWTAKLASNLQTCVSRDAFWHVYSRLSSIFHGFHMFPCFSREVGNPWNSEVVRCYAGALAHNLQYSQSDSPTVQPLEGMPTSTASLRQQTQNLRRAIRILLLASLFSWLSTLHIPLPLFQFITSIEPFEISARWKEKGFPIQLTNWWEAERSRCRNPQRILSALKHFCRCFSLLRFSVWSILYTKPGSGLNLSGLLFNPRF